MTRGLFITATDTGVGKTLIACGIARWLRSEGLRVGVMKPVSSGDRNDAKRLIAAAQIREDLDVVNPQHFRAPLAPSVAASLERRAVDMDRIYQAYWALHKRYDVLIVEGAGGVKVPLAESTYVMDLIAAFRLPALVVARAGLGTINHSLLTLDALDQAKIEVVGLLLNGGSGKTLAEATNPDEIQDHTAFPVLGHLRNRSVYPRDVDALARALRKIPRLSKAVQRICGPS